MEHPNIQVKINVNADEFISGFDISGKAFKQVIHTFTKLAGEFIKKLYSKESYAKTGYRFGKSNRGFKKWRKLELKKIL